MQQPSSNATATGCVSRKPANGAPQNVRGARDVAWVTHLLDSSNNPPGESGARLQRARERRSGHEPLSKAGSSHATVRLDSGRNDRLSSDRCCTHDRRVRLCATHRKYVHGFFSVSSRPVRSDPTRMTYTGDVPRLIVISGPAAGEVFLLEAGEIVLGWDPATRSPSPIRRCRGGTARSTGPATAGRCAILEASTGPS